MHLVSGLTCYQSPSARARNRSPESGKMAIARNSIPAVFDQKISASWSSPVEIGPESPPDAIPKVVEAIFTNRPGLVRNIDGKWARHEPNDAARDYVKSHGLPCPLENRTNAQRDRYEHSAPCVSWYSTMKSSKLFRRTPRVGRAGVEADDDDEIPPELWFTTYYEDQISRFGTVCPSIIYGGKHRCRWTLEAELCGHQLSQSGVGKIQRQKIQGEASNNTTEKQSAVDLGEAMRQSNVRVGGWALATPDTAKSRNIQHRTRNHRAPRPRILPQEDDGQDIELMQLPGPRHPVPRGPQGDSSRSQRRSQGPMRQGVGNIPNKNSHQQKQNSRIMNCPGHRLPTHGARPAQEEKPEAHHPPGDPRGKFRALPEVEPASRPSHSARAPLPPLHDPQGSRLLSTNTSSRSPRPPAHGRLPDHRPSSHPVLQPLRQRVHDSSQSTPSGPRRMMSFSKARYGPGGSHRASRDSSEHGVSDLSVRDLFEPFSHISSRITIPSSVDSVRRSDSNVHGSGARRVQKDTVPPGPPEHAGVNPIEGTTGNDTFVQNLQSLSPPEKDPALPKALSVRIRELPLE